MFDEPSSYTDMLLLQNISQEIAAAIGNETKIVTLGNQAALLASAQTTFKKAAWSGIGAFTPNMEVYAAIAGEPEDPTSAAERTAFDLWRQEGKEAWWYSSGMLMGNWSDGFQLGVPAIRSRLKMGHLSWKYQVDGFIYYQLFAWEPYCEEPWRSCTAVGTTPTLELTNFFNDRQTWDGEGQLAVPGPDGVLATLHLESVRDGCEYSNGHQTLCRPWQRESHEMLNTLSAHFTLRCIHRSCHLTQTVAAIRRRLRAVLDAERAARRILHRRRRAAFRGRGAAALPPC